MEDRMEEIARRIILQRKDEYLNQLLEEWREEYGVEIDEDALAKMPSWETVTAPQPLTGQIS
jgi:hypothetical protein